MSVKIGHASIDENGKARGGKSGDQTKKEVCVRNWYNNLGKPWTAVIRPNSDIVAEKIAEAMEQACANDNIGYDQNQRTTLYVQAKAVNFDLSKITEKCETDCSALVAVCVNAAGIAVSKDIYTGNEKAALTKTGNFTVYTSHTYIASDKKLKRGDILLGNGHTAVVLSNGEDLEGMVDTNNASLNRIPKWVGEVNCNNLVVRKWAGTEFDAIKSWPKLNKGNKIDVCDSVKDSKGKTWYYIRIDGRIYGFVASWYIKKLEIALKVGDIVNFTGNLHYASANAKEGKNCKPGQVQITSIYKLNTSKHPYHVKRVSGGTSTAYGWVDAKDVELL